MYQKVWLRLTTAVKLSLSELPGRQSKEGNAVHYLPLMKEQAAFSKVRKVFLVDKRINVGIF